MEKLYNLNEILEILGIKRTTFYRLRKVGAFPKPLLLTGNTKSMRWTKEQIEYYLKEKEKYAQKMK